MSGFATQRTRRVQFDLAALFVLTTVIAAAVALALEAADNPAAGMSALYVAAPLAVGICVGQISRSRAQLLTAPPLAAAIVPLPLAALAAFYAPSGNPLAEFLVWWVMLFPIVLVMGAVAALIGAALGYWLKRRRTPRAS